MANTEEKITALKTHLACPDCGSSDALTLNVDGSTKCFSCEKFTPSHTTTTVNHQPLPTSFVGGEFQDLPKRCIQEDICRKYDYRVGQKDGKPCHIANYRDRDGKVVGQKIRFPDKTFRIIGKVNTPFGWHLFQGGRRITVTEGEIDTLSVATVLEGKWAVVSLPSGAGNANKTFKDHLEYFESFDEVVLMFDQDEAGRQAAKNCASILSIGKARIAHLSAKDPNDLLTEGRGAEIVQAGWNAKPWRPDGIVEGTDMWDLITDDTEVESAQYPYAGLNKVTRGIRVGEITTFCAGSGVGKSSVCREIAYGLLNQGQKVGYIALEESIKRTALGIMGLHCNTQLHLGEVVPEEVMDQAFKATVGSGNFVTYDHWGSIESDNLINRIRYMNKALGCKWIFLDHVSIVVSGQDGDERKMIDMLMTKLRSLVEETQVGMLLVSHLKRPEGRGFEEGRETTLGHLRGSAGLGQLSDMVIGVERNQQDEDLKNRTTVRILKNRFSGETGEACFLRYNNQTGRLVEETLEDLPEDTDTNNPF
jgi:twinkle protein